MNKSAFYRTLEVLIAIVLTFVFVIYFIPQFASTETPKKNSLDLNIIERLDGNEDFRNCVMGESESCVETEIDKIIPFGFGFDTSISNDVNYKKTGLPLAKDIYIESALVSSNLTLYSPKILKVYYWRK